jgi:ATP-dependent helicase/nuclease subunit A
MLELIDAGIKASQLDGAFDLVSLYEEVEFPPGTAARPDPGPAWSALERFWRELQRTLPEQIDDETTCPVQQRARRFTRQLRIASAQPKTAANVLRLLETWDFNPRVIQQWWADDAASRRRISQDVLALHTTFRSTVVAPFVRQWREYVYRLSMTLLTRARMHVAAERRRQNVLNYGDLLQLAARVLRENADVRRALGEKYRWLFVDEFQDTDPVQAEIIFLLASQTHPNPTASTGVGSDPVQVDWRTIPIRPAALFVVGDPKQSIYRFRRADIDVYNEVHARLEIPACGEVLPLSTNFRSVPALCEWANEVFSQQFPNAPTTYSPKFAPLDPDRKPGGAATGLFTLTISQDVDEADAAAAEAERIARCIRATVDARRRSFGDFLILTRKKKNLGVYANALEALQIPLEVSGAGAFGDSPEVRQLAVLLRALADPQDAVSLVGVLRGPLFGLSDRELFAYRQVGGWFNMFAEITTDDAAAIRVADALGSLRQMFRWTRVMPAAAALERILDHTGYLALAATSPDGVDAGDLLHALDRVRNVVEDGLSLMDAAATLDEDAEESSEVESLPLEPGRGDVVRLMNLHKAKGLEAAVVFLADPCGGVKPWVDVRIIRDGPDANGYCLIKTPFGKGTKIVGRPEGWTNYETEELRYLEGEERRLLYVAATRAQDALVVGRWEGTGGHGRRSWIAFEPFLSAARELKVPRGVTPPRPQWVDLSAGAAAAAFAETVAAHDRVRVPSWSATSVTTEARHIPKIVQAQEAAADDPTAVVSADTPSRRADAGMAWGTLIHGLLEHAMRYKAATRDDLRRLAMWLTVEQPELRRAIDKAVDTVQVVSRAAFWAEARESSQADEEVPFGILGSEGARPQLLNGVIDLVYQTKNAWRIVDYKTDVNVAPGLSTRYREQIGRYEAAWRRFVQGDIVSTVVPTSGAAGKSDRTVIEES